MTAVLLIFLVVILPGALIALNAAISDTDKRGPDRHNPATWGDGK